MFLRQVFSNTLGERIPTTGIIALVLFQGMALCALFAFANNPFLTVFFAFGFLWLLKPLGQVYLGWREEQMWRSVYANAGSAGHFAERPQFAFESVNSDFELPELTAPKTCWIREKSIRWVFFAVIVALSAAIAVAIKNPGNGLLLAFIFLAFAVACFSQVRMIPLADSWAPVPNILEISEPRFSETGYHLYHKAVLDSLGFRSIGWFQIRREHFELFVSDQKTCLARLGRMPFGREGKRHIHYYSFQSIFQNLSDLKTVCDSLETLESQNGKNARPRTDDTGNLQSSLREHMARANQHIDAEQLRVVSVQSSNALNLMTRIELLEKIETQNRIQQQQQEQFKLPRWLPKSLRVSLLPQRVST